MDILAFIYYMLHSIFYKMGQFISRNSPFVVNKDARHTNKNIDISVTNTTNAFYMLGVALYSMDIYIYMPFCGFGELQQDLLSIMSRESVVVCIAIILGIPMYFAYFFNNRFVKKAEKFKKMSILLIFSYSLVAIAIIILPIILLFAAIPLISRTR